MFLGTWFKDMRTLLSAHLIPLHWGPEDAYQLSRIKPRSVKCVNQLDGRMHELQTLSPNSVFVYRDHPKSEEHDSMFHDPRGTGIRHANDWAEKFSRWNHSAPDVQKIVLGINEPHVWDPGGVEITTLYTVAFLDRLTEHGIRGGALNFSVGWPANTGKDTPPNWEPYEPVRDAILRGNHVLFVHEYWPHEGPGFRWSWLAGRVLQCPWNVPIIVGECGMEERVKPVNLPPEKWGWQGWLSQGEYLSQLLEYESAMATDPRVHSLQVFTWDFSNPYGSLDIRPLLDKLPANSSWDNALVTPVKPPRPDPDFEERLLAAGEKALAIQFNPDAALQKEISADRFSPNSNVFPFDDFVAQRAEDLKDGRVRVYYVSPQNWGDVRWVQRK